MNTAKILKAQEMVIGLILKNVEKKNADFGEAVKKLDVHCFARPEGKENSCAVEVFRLIEKIKNRNEEISIVSLQIEAEEKTAEERKVINDFAVDALSAALSPTESPVEYVKTLTEYRAELLAETPEGYRERYSAAGYMELFANGIEESANTPCIPTGFLRLDEVLGGGLYPGLYSIGAISSIGKTTLIMQIADSIAKRGTDVMIFSLEMARTELMAKSISRCTYEIALEEKMPSSLAKTARGITDGNLYRDYGDGDRKMIALAVERYRSYAGHLYIEEGMGDIGVQTIRKRIQEHINMTGQTPVVVIDYLQLLAPYNERMTDKQNTDKAVLELKRLTRDLKLPLIAISSLNRASYKESISMGAFKESGAIEYTTDCLIGLQLVGTGEENFDSTEAKRKTERNIELLILKNRNGSVGDKINYKYLPKFNFFAEDHTPAEEKAKAERMVF